MSAMRHERTLGCRRDADIHDGPAPAAIRPHLGEVIAENTPEDRLVVVVGPGVEHPLDGGGYDTRHQLPLRLIRKATLRPPQGGFLGRFDRRASC